MIRWIGRALTVLALCSAIGLHWIALQSIAWTAMMVEYSQCAPLPQAISRAFDGAHPCSLCHAVTKGKASEEKRNTQAQMPKIDIVAVICEIHLRTRDIPFEFPSRSFVFTELGHSPPAPPPRS